MSEETKKKGGVMGYVLSGLGGFVLGFGAGWVGNDMAREAEANAAKAPATK